MFRIQSRLQLQARKALLETSRNRKHTIPGCRFSTIPITPSSITSFIPAVVKKNAGMTIFLSILGSIGLMIYRTSAVLFFFCLFFFLAFKYAHDLYSYRLLQTLMK